MLNRALILIECLIVLPFFVVVTPLAAFFTTVEQDEKVIRYWEDLIKRLENF